MFYGADPIIFKYAGFLRKHPAKAEQTLWEYLRNKQLKVKFRRQHPIANYIADFYCHEMKLVVEIDGDYHSHSEQMKHDEFRTEELKELGIKVIRFSNEQIFNNIEFVLDQLKKEITSFKHPV